MAGLPLLWLRCFGRFALVGVTLPRVTPVSVVILIEICRVTPDMSHASFALRQFLSSVTPVMPHACLALRQSLF